VKISLGMSAFSGGYKNFENKGAEDCVSAPSSVLANTYNKLRVLAYTGKIQRGAIAPAPTLNTSLSAVAMV